MEMHQNEIGPSPKVYTDLISDDIEFLGKLNASSFKPVPTEFPYGCLLCETFNVSSHVAEAFQFIR